MMASSARARFIVGPLGSGKTMGCIVELLRRALEQAPDRQGIRPTRFVIIRNTMAQLRATVLADVRSYLGPILRYRVTDTALQFRIPLPDGTSVESDWLLIPLETQEDTRRLLSLQLTGGWIEEFREVPFQIVAPLLGRVGRYPQLARVAPSWSGIIGSSNPYAVGSEWHEALEVTPRDNWALFRQPSGLSPDAENIENLPPNYYKNLAEENSEEWVAVHVHARNGESLAGQAVFRTSFVPDAHLVDTLEPQRGRALVIGLDFGRTPAAVLLQTDAHGRILVLEEITSTDMGLQQFLQTKLRPIVSGERYAMCQVVVSFDPSGVTKSQINEMSCWDVLKAEGWVSYPAPTNDIPPRLRAIERELLATRVVTDSETGKSRQTPALLISRHHCPTLVKAFMGDYKYKRRRDQSLEETPDKNHPYSDVMDACGYGIMGLSAGVVGRVMTQLAAAQTKRAPVPATAWT
jgi:hypothetical protein